MFVEKKILSPREVEAEYGYPERTLETWRTRGRGPAWLRIGTRSVRYDRADIEAWQASIRVTPKRLQLVDPDDNSAADPFGPPPAIN
jgi:predicted DNA-binding transcriptional regulator AlpA